MYGWNSEEGSSPRLPFAPRRRLIVHDDDSDQNARDRDRQTAQDPRTARTKETAKDAEKSRPSGTARDRETGRDREIRIERRRMSVTANRETSPMYTPRETEDLRGLIALKQAQKKQGPGSDTKKRTLPYKLTHPDNTRDDRAKSHEHRPHADRRSADRRSADRHSADRHSADRTGADRRQPDRPRFDKGHLDRDKPRERGSPRTLLGVNVSVYVSPPRVPESGNLKRRSPSRSPVLRVRKDSVDVERRVTERSRSRWPPDIRRSSSSLSRHPLERTRRVPDPRRAGFSPPDPTRRDTPRTLEANRRTCAPIEEEDKSRANRSHRDRRTGNDGKERETLEAGQVEEATDSERNFKVRRLQDRPADEAMSDSVHTASVQALSVQARSEQSARVQSAGIRGRPGTARFQPRSLQDLIFPDLGGSPSSPLSVPVQIVGERGIGLIMLIFEMRCLRLLGVRHGFKRRDFAARIPRVAERHIHKALDLRPWWLRKEVPRVQADMSAEEFNSAVMMPYIDALEKYTTTARETESTPIRGETEQSSSDATSRYLSAENTPSSAASEDERKTSLYSPKLVSFYLDEEKVGALHPQRHEPLNKRLSFVTRSLLWCLRANTTIGRKRGVSCANATSPRERSVELNADVMNAWMILLQDWADTLNAARRVKVEKKMEVMVSCSESEKSGSGMNRGPKEEGSVKVERPLEKKVLYLTTDFMTQFETALIPKRPPGDMEEVGVEALHTTEAVSGMKFACERLFRFFKKRNLNPWEYEYVCWPLNYLCAHWVLLTVDMKGRKFIWADSYRKCYLQSVQQQLQEYERVRMHPKIVHVNSAKVNESQSSLGQNSINDDLENLHKMLSEGKNDNFTADLLNCNGWIYFVCMEEYLKFDFAQRNPSQSLGKLQYLTIHGHQIYAYRRVGELGESVCGWGTAAVKAVA